MNTSSGTTEISKALAAAQAKMEHATASSTNPHFKSKYADLAEIFDTARTPLTANGLSVWQSVGGERDSLKLTTRLLHISGEWIEDTMPLILSKQDMQGLGSAITYGRRYALMSALGIAPDDDGNAASGRPTQHHSAEPAPVVGISEDAIEKLNKTMTQHLWKNGDVVDYIRMKWNKGSPRTLNTSQFTELMDVIVKNTPAQALVKK